VLVVGAGGLGSPVALWLAAAGVGRLVLADPDVVDVTNLHRQLLHGMADVGRPKVASAADRIAAIGAGTRVAGHPVALDAANADALLAGCAVAVDCTDALPPRYALSDACVRAGVPMVHGSVARWEGRVAVLCAPGADVPCYRCLWPDPADGRAADVPTCDAAGVLGVAPGLVGMMQATETLKLLLGLGSPLAGVLWVTDLRSHVTHRVRLARDPLCAACGEDRIRRTGGGTPATPWADAGHPRPPARAPILLDSALPTEPRRVSRPDAAADPSIPEISPETLADRLRAPEPPMLVDVREPWEHEVARIPGARLVPMNSLPAALSTFDPAREYVIHCHHGVRSLMAAQFLRERGLTRVTNLSGGIDAWSVQVDPSVPRY
jgi:adenylyltransferase/sulfurtransferase